MAKRKVTKRRPADLVRCATRALKNARYLQESAADAIPRPGSPEGFGTGIPIPVLARLHRLPHDHPDLRAYKPLAAYLQHNRLPMPGRNARDALFNGTIFFVQVKFNVPGGPFVVADADMNTIVEYAQHAVVPISEYARQYGANAVQAAPGFIRHSVTLASTSYGDSDVQTWVNDIVRVNSLPLTSCVAIVSPQGMNGTGVGGNSGYHSKANAVYTIFGVFATGIGLQDLGDVYAMVVSHEIAELVVDPNVDGQNPEVCDPCDINCGPLHRCYFDASDNFLGATATLPPAFAFSYYICAVVNTAGAASCPAPDGDCNYAPASTGHLWHTLRRADGSWTGLGDVEGQFRIPGPVAAAAGTGGSPGETQFVFTTGDGHLWHTLRRVDGSWTGLGDVEGQFALPGPVVAVAAAIGLPGETQFMFTTSDGHLWHTLRRADGSWSGLGDVEGQFAIPGPVAAVAGTGGLLGETQFIFTTNDGHLWHTLRRLDGSWTGLGDVQGQFAIPGPVVAVAAAIGAPGETQFMFTTSDGHLWHTLRRADGSWTGLDDVEGQFAIPGPVAEVAGTGGGLPGETQFLFTTSDGHLWHTLRRADGSWTGLGDVQGQFAVPGPVVAVAAAAGLPGETQFMFTT